MPSKRPSAINMTDFVIEQRLTMRPREIEAAIRGISGTSSSFPPHGHWTAVLIISYYCLRCYLPPVTLKWQLTKTTSNFSLFRVSQSSRHCFLRWSHIVTFLTFRKLCPRSRDLMNFIVFNGLFTAHPIPTTIYYDTYHNDDPDQSTNDNTGYHTTR